LTSIGRGSKEQKSEAVGRILAEHITGAMLHVGGATLIDQVAAVAVGLYGKRAIRDAATSFGEAITEKMRDGDPEWMQELARSRTTGSLLPSADNIYAILSHDDRWKGLIQWDEMGARTVFGATPPISRGKETKKGDPWEDQDDTRLAVWLGTEWDLHVDPHRVAPIVEQVAQDHRVHPLRDRIRAVTWDGTERLSTWLSTHCTVEDSEHTRLVGRMWMIQAIARLEKPGCQADAMLIFEGLEGKKKGTAFETISYGGSTYLGDLREVGTVGSKEQIRAKWIVNMDELASITGSKAESETVKSFITVRSDNYRQAYGRRALDYPRTCIFGGTTNETSAYLRDAEGNRRFWPVRITGMIDIAALERDRDQLWAEALHAYRAGERYWVETDEERELCRAVRASREAGDLWEDRVREYLDEQSETTAAEILVAIGVPLKDQNRSHQTRIGSIMRRVAEFERRQVGRTWKYVRVGGDVRSSGLAIDAGSTPRPRLHLVPSVDDEIRQAVLDV
jgi:putative DNA primase/helicase